MQPSRAFDPGSFRAGAGIDLAPPPPPRPIQWRRTTRILRALIENPAATEKVFELIEAERVTHFIGVPANYLFMSQVPAFAEASFPTIEAASVGGSPTPAGTVGSATTATAPTINVGEGRPTNTMASESASSSAHSSASSATGGGSDPVGKMPA